MLKKQLIAKGFFGILYWIFFVEYGIVKNVKAFVEA
jgi:hypothetical protein